MTVVELWRYPVKSLRGEQLDAAEIDRRGIAGDRVFAVTDVNGKLGSGKTTTRFRLFPGLFEMRAKTHDGRAWVVLPDGRELDVDDPRLTAFLNERYGEALTVRRESTVPHHDAAPLHLLTTASLRWLQNELPTSVVDRRRFRPNILLDVAGAGLVEDDWVGRAFTLGGTVIRVVKRTERCVMVTNAQDGVPQDPRVLRAVTQLNDQCLGVLAVVERGGTVRLGDELTLIREAEERTA